MRLPAGDNRDLILTRAGPKSLHPGWLAPKEGEQRFDLIVLSYGPTPLAYDRTDFGHIEIPGHKVAGYGAFLRNHSNIIERYDQVAMIDDDIEADYNTLARAFELGRSHNLKIWQPSLSSKSYFSYAAHLDQSGGCKPRYINFVEMMCPFFQSATLLEMSNLFMIGAETGIDVLWSCILGEDPWALAVLDGVTVTHARPVGLLKSMNGFQASYNDYIQRVLHQFDVRRFPGAIPIGFPPQHNPTAIVRLRLALSALNVISAIRETPMPKKLFVQALLAGLRQILIKDTRIFGRPAIILERAKQYAAANSRAMALGDGAAELR